MIEKVQIRVVKYCASKMNRYLVFYYDKYAPFLELLDMQSLEKRRIINNFTFIYKLVNGFTLFPGLLDVYILGPFKYFRSQIITRNKT